MQPTPESTPIPPAATSVARSGGRALWRKLHRWFGAGAALFLLIVSGTGIALQWQSVFGDEEAEKERLAEQTSAFLLTTPLDTMSAQLAAAQAAVRVEAGSAPLDRVLWQLKGDHPTLTFFIGGQPARRFVVNARTGVIERRLSGDEESWILRLHSGEIIGDGGKVLGLFWGSALLFLTVSGVVIYWQMRRPGATGLKKILWMLVFAALFTPPHMLFAGPPFLTDDPGMAPKGWDVYTNAVYTKTSGGHTLTAPILDVSYSLTPRFKFNATMAYATLSPIGAPSQSGITDTDFKFKWRFTDADEKTGAWDVGIAPTVTFPTASKTKGIGDGLWRYRVPLIFGKSWGRVTVQAEIGYKFVAGRGMSDELAGGADLQYALGDAWTIGAELYDTVPIKNTSAHNPLVNFGAARKVREGWLVMASVGRTLRPERMGGPHLFFQLFSEWLF